MHLFSRAVDPQQLVERNIFSLECQGQLSGGSSTTVCNFRSRGCLAILAAAVISFPVLASPISPSDPAIGSGVVYRVVDGDTYVVNLDDPELFQRFISAAGKDRGRLRYLDERFQSIRVRLANINTPESVHSNASQNTREGKAASVQVKRLIEGKPVQVLCHDWGRYGRSICNVRLEGRDDVGLWLIENGYSQYVTKWGKNPYLHVEYTQANSARAQ